MRLLLMFIVIITSGCSTLPTNMPETARIDTKITVHKTVFDLNVTYSLRGGKIDQDYQILGFQYWLGDVCQVHFVAGDYDTLAHEIAHCYHGGFHE